MSSTITTTRTKPRSMTLTMLSHDSVSTALPVCCPNCANPLSSVQNQLASDAQQMIEALQTQVMLLTQKATAAVDKWADYEDELRSLRAQQEAVKASPPRSGAGSRSVTPDSSYLPVSSRLSSFLTARRSTASLRTDQTAGVSNLAPSTHIHDAMSGIPARPPTPAEESLSLALQEERKARQDSESARRKAELGLKEASGELEDLTVKLFEQANEMVATERIERAKLEDRVRMLEQRDVEKRERLERLEKAMGRIERVRGLLGS